MPVLVPLRWLCLFVFLPFTSSLVVQSRDDNSLGTALVRDETDDKLLMIGVTFESGSSSTTDTNWLVRVLGDYSKDRTAERIALEQPHICTCGLVVNHGVNGRAIIAGISGNQAMLQPLEDFSSTQPRAGLPHNLPKHTIPVAMADVADRYNTEAMANYMFVAVHDTDGSVYTQTTDGDSTRDLKRLTNYLHRMSQPETASASPPQLIKVDPFSGAVAFQIPLDVQDGKATIAGLQTYDHYLIVAGSTNGRGSAVGNKKIKLSGKSNWDGYIGFFNAVTGKVEAEAIRIETDKNDYVSRILCCLELSYRST
jgi:hypothetical protein